MTERDYQTAIVHMARLLGYVVKHAPNSRTKTGRYSNQGMTDWPDLTLIRPPRIIFAELKAAKTPVRPGQTALLQLLHDCGLEAYLWRVTETSLQDVADVLTTKVTA